MKEHVQECPVNGMPIHMTDLDHYYGRYECQCEILRACEGRVEESMDRAWQGVFISGVAYTRIKTLDDARKAVADVLEPEHENTCWPLVFGVIAPCLTCKALAAIDALRQERSGNPDTQLSAENADPPLICGECQTEIALDDVGCLHLADNDDFGHIGTIAAIDGLRSQEHSLACYTVGGACSLCNALDAIDALKEQP